MKFGAEKSHFGIGVKDLEESGVDVAVLYEVPEEMRVEMLSVYDFANKVSEEQKQPSAADMANMFANNSQANMNFEIPQ
jgi:hypothetical protein